MNSSFTAEPWRTRRQRRDRATGFAPSNWQRKMILLCCLLATIPANYASTLQGEDSSLMRSSDIAYTETMKFARLLNEHGLTVKSSHRSILNGFFRGLNKAAFLRTDKGVVEVIFFDEARGAEKVQVTEQRQSGR